MSTAGAFILGAGLLLAFLVLMYSLWRGKKAPRNPWGGATLEWRCASPPPYYNFARPPAVGDPYYFDDIEYDANSEDYVFTEPDREIVPQTPDSSPQPVEAEKNV